MLSSEAASQTHPKRRSLSERNCRGVRGSGVVFLGNSKKPLSVFCDTAVSQQCYAYGLAPTCFSPMHRQSLHLPTTHAYAFSLYAHFVLLHGSRKRRRAAGRAAACTGNGRWHHRLAQVRRRQAPAARPETESRPGRRVPEWAIRQSWRHNDSVLPIKSSP